MGLCLICENPTKKETAKFCSIKCKNRAQSVKKEKLDPHINIRCKIDGKLFSDYENRSGILRRHSENILKKEFVWSDWEQIRIELKPTWKCPYCEWKSTDVTNNSGCITTHLQTKHNLSPESHCERYPDDNRLWKHHWMMQERKQFLLESEDNRIQCLECGEWFRTISNTHLRNKHNITEEEYVRKHGETSLSSNAYREKMSRYLQINGNPNTTFKSKYEDQICLILDEYSISYHRHWMKLGFEIDIFIPEKNIGIEFNGLFFHSEYGGGKLKYYHRNKTDECEKHGIHLIHIFEDEWIHQEEIVKSRLKNILGLSSKILYARKCNIREISFSQSMDFLYKNHLQGKTQASNINIGLFFDEELVALMTFGFLSIDKGTKYRTPGEFELKRFCSKLNLNVIGAANKLLSFFERTYNPTSILSFANRCWTSSIKNSVYDAMGFTLIGKTDPNYWYLVESNKRTHRFTYTKSNILKKFPNANPELSEIENMISMGFDRIWDVGSLKYMKNYNSDIPIIDLEITDIQPEIQRVRKYRRNKSQDKKRISNDVVCEICKNEYSVTGMFTHLKLNHKLTPDEYVNQYSEYRPKYINNAKRLSEVGDTFKCLECHTRQMSNKQLVQHINKNHGSFEEYAIKHFFAGEQPKCRCGCNGNVSIKTTHPYQNEYISGHNPNGMIGRKHRLESKEKQRSKSIGRYTLSWFIERYGEVEGQLKYSERSKQLSERFK